ncbi:MAG: hypothetical protein M3Y54_22365, partial [Bacteroidota bacterium]|nr:hypothetical protein [Bacteroidota bacterium]
MKTPRNSCQHCKRVLPSGKQKYCGSDCRQAAYRRRDADELGPELAADVRQVRRMVEAGALPEAYGEAVNDLRQLVKDAAELPGVVKSLLEYVIRIALAHCERAATPAEHEEAGGDHNVALLVRIMHLSGLPELSRLAGEARNAVGLAAETFADGAIGAELQSVLYARQVNLAEQANDENDDENGGELC